MYLYPLFLCDYYCVLSSGAPRTPFTGVVSGSELPNYGTQCPRKTRTPKLRRPCPQKTCYLLSLSLFCLSWICFSVTISCLFHLLKLNLSFPLTLSLIWNGTWNDQHTFPLGGFDWFMWELLQSFTFLVLICPGRWKEEQSKLMAQTSAAFSFLWNRSLMPGFTRGSLQSQSNNEEERRVTGEGGGVWWQTGEREKGK